MGNEILTVYSVKAEVGISKVGEVYTYAEISAGFDNVDESLNEIIQQYFFLSGQGFGTNHVTGMAPSWKFAGRRVQGDPVQDYFFANKYALGASRQSSLRITITDNSSGTPVVKTVTVPCTFCNVKEISGASTDDSAISVEIRFDSKPVTANVAALPALILVSVAGTTGGKTKLYVNPAKGAGNTYRYKTAISIAALGMLALGASASGWTAWDGSAEITATTGHVIGLIECDASVNAVKGGMATVTSL